MLPFLMKLYARPTAASDSANNARPIELLRRVHDQLAAMEVGVLRAAPWVAGTHHRRVHRLVECRCTGVPLLPPPSPLWDTWYQDNF